MAMSKPSSSSEAIRFPYSSISWIVILTVGNRSQGRHTRWRSQYNPESRGRSGHDWDGGLRDVAMAAPESTTSPLSFALPPSVKGLSRVADVVRNRLPPQIQELMGLWALRPYKRNHQNWCCFSHLEWNWSYDAKFQSKLVTLSTPAWATVTKAVVLRLAETLLGLIDTWAVAICLTLNRKSDA